MGWGIETKLPILTKRDLSLVYTPGVGECCLKIKQNPKMVMELTNKANSIAIFAFESKSNQAKEKAESYRMIGFDSYPIILKKMNIPTQRILESLKPTFGYFDISLIGEHLDESKFSTYIPKVPLSYDVPMAIDLSDDIKIAAVELHMHTRGVIKQAWCYDEPKLVGVVSNGSAVLGFGKIGPDAAMPVMEGKAALFKKFGGVDAIPICVDACCVQEFKNIVKSLEPTFSGLNLEDICAPDCFDIEEELIKEMNIPIFHDDQHGTAIVVLAGIINALALIGKDKTQAKVVFSGAGAAAVAVCKLLLAYGFTNITLTDINGAIYKGREQNDKYLEQMAQKTNPESIKGTLKDAIKGADIFIGLSAQGVLTPDMIKTMSDKPVIFALANPNPEIMPDEAKEAGAYIIATGRSDFPNQVNNSLVFPGVFKGILQSDVKVIDDIIKIKAAKALAEKVDDVSVNKIIPDPMDMEIAQIISAAIVDKQG